MTDNQHTGFHIGASMLRADLEQIIDTLARANLDTLINPVHFYLHKRSGPTHDAARKQYCGEIIVSSEGIVWESHQLLGAWHDRRECKTAKEALDYAANYKPR